MFLYNISNTTLFIVIGFLIATLVLGLYAGKGIKNIKEYILGKGGFTIVTLTLTFLATDIGAYNLLIYPYKVYSIGLIMFSFWIGVTIQNLLLGLIIAPKAAVFKDCFTIGDFVGRYYGKYAKLLTGILTLIRMICLVSIQLVAIGKILQFFFHINIFWGVMISGFILGLYTAFGGIKSVTYTDVFQFLLLAITVPIISTLLTKNFMSYKKLFYALPKDKLLIFTKKEFIQHLTYGLILSFSFSALVSPSLMQRIFMAKKGRDAQKMFFSVTVIELVFGLSVTLIGLCCLALYPNIKSDNMILEVINKICTNNILKGLIISGVLSVAISSVDSYLHSTGLILFNDLISPIIKIKEEKKLNILKLTTFAIAIIISIISLSFINSSIFNDLNLIKNLINLPILVFPILFAIFGIKGNKKLFYVSVSAGFVIVCICYFYIFPGQKSISVALGMLANGLIFLFFHILQNKGIAWIQREEEDKEKSKPKTNLWIPQPTKILKKLLSYIPGPKNIYSYSRFQVMKHGSENIIFGIYCCVNFTLPYVMWDSNDPERYNIMTNLRFIGGIMAGLLIVKDEWKNFLKPYYPLYWHITLTYCLPFITTVMFLLSKGSLLWLIQIAVSIFMLIILVAGEVFLILAPLGILLGLAFYKYFVGPINILSLGFDTNYYLIYSLLFPTIIGLLFAYKKRIFNRKTVNIGINLGLSLCHEIRNTLSALTYSDMAKISLDRIKEKTKLETRNGEKGYFIKQNSFNSVYDFVDTSLGLNYDTVKVLSAFENLFIEMKKSNINMEIDSVEETVHNTLTDLHFHPGQLEKVEVDLRDDFLIQLPKAQFSFVLSNLIRNAFKHGGPTKVEIHSENNKLIIRDDGKGIPEENKERIFQMGYTTGKKGESSGIGLWFSKIIVNSFNGEISCNSSQGLSSYTEFTIKFPELDPTKITDEDRKRINTKKKERIKKMRNMEIAKEMQKEGKTEEEIETRTGLKPSEIIKYKII
ncbi:MAG: hypothetical protein GY830_04065 [Bacteroidetes bacterium]|nr:hypothetical protein [Bacteroidota bacterium]